jgi:acyl-CoA thioester hydrolase
MGRDVRVPAREQRRLLYYFESASIVYSEKLGLHMLKEQTGIGTMLGSTSCRYKLPLTYPDMISLGAKITGMEEDRFTMKYIVVSHKHQRIAAEGDGVIVMYNYTEGKKTAIPEEVRKKVLSWSSFCPDKTSNLTIGN